MPDRISGKLGQVYIKKQDSTPVTVDSSNLVGLLYEWNLEFNVEAEPCGIKGEIAEKHSYGPLTGRITARRFASDLAADAGAANNGLTGFALQAAATAGSAATGGDEYYVLLKQIAGAGVGTQIACNAMFVRGSLDSPRQMATDSCEWTITSVPAIT